MVDKVLHAQMPFTTGGQTINDRLTAAYHSVAGSQMGKTVCKATTEEPIGPKKKHLDYLLHCTHEPNINIPQLANCLIERTSNTNWAVVYKSLITIHNLMCYGNERFSQYLASSNANFNLANFLDKASVQGYDMSTHVRRYAKYISEKIYTYRMMAFDFCKVKRGREDGMLRTMNADKLLKALPFLQQQVDALLEFQVTSNELTNGVINSCFILLFRDLVRLFACYNDGIINLLEKYFDMNKKQCREALDLYKQFLIRMDKVAEFLKVAESVGIDRGEIPDLAKAPGSLIEALEQHLNALEGNKVVSGNKPVFSSSGPSAATRSEIQKFSSSGFKEPSAGYVDPTTLDEGLKRKILEEEEQRLNMLKEQRLRELEFSQKKDSSVSAAPREENKHQSTSSKSITFGSPSRHVDHSISASVQASKSNVDDLLSLDLASPPPQQVQQTNNPFLTNFNSFPSQPLPQQFAPQPQSLFGNNALYSNGHQQQQTGGFASDETFAKAFGNAPQQNNSSFGSDLLTPQPVGGSSNVGTSSSSFFMEQTSTTSKKVGQDSSSKLVRGDLDSSLANLAENLNIGKGQENLKKPVQWGPTKGATQHSSMVSNTSMATGASFFSPAPAATTPTYGAGGYQTGVFGAAPGVNSGIMMQNPYGQPRPPYQPAYGGASAYPMAPANQTTAGGFGYQRSAQFGAQDPFGVL